MNTYLLPIADNEYQKTWIESVKARGFTEAKDKFMESITNEFDLDVPMDWDDFVRILSEGNFIIGNISDVEEF